MRRVDLVVLSDIHLGINACHAEEVLDYLATVRPKTLILNGDILDIIQARSTAWSDFQVRVVRKLLKTLEYGTTVYYVTGNHDAALRNYSGWLAGDFHLVDRLDLVLDDKRYLVVHGDGFDCAMGAWRWLRGVGGISYNLLMAMNNAVNSIRRLFGRKPFSLATAIRKKFAAASAYIARFKAIAMQHAEKQGYDGIICGHIHAPELDLTGPVAYLNSGDWVSHCTALEYNDGQWQLHQQEIASAVQSTTAEDLAFDHKQVVVVS